MRVIGEPPVPKRPGRWLPSMAEIIYRMALVGMSRGDMAYALGIKAKVFIAWDCQSIASSCIRNGGVSKYDPNAPFKQQSIYDLIRRGRSVRNLISEAYKFMPEPALASETQASLNWLFNQPVHYLLDEWKADLYAITLRRPAELPQKRWLDGSSGPILIYRLPLDFDTLYDLLNDWRIPMRERESILLKLGDSVHKALCINHFWG